jgi:asparagine synthase (glutamine-hydrolysing)
VLLNAAELRRDRAATDNAVLLSRLAAESPTGFPASLRGDFCGLVWCSKEESVALFTSHVGGKPLFYFHDPVAPLFAFAADPLVLGRLLTRWGYRLRLDVDGAYLMLTLGFTFGQHTLIEGIRRLPHGSVLRYRPGELRVERYYRPENEPPSRSDRRSLVGGLQARFERAVLAEYRKDAEYGYRPLATLSGGLDSRMNVGYGARLCLGPILCLTFAETGSADETIARRIARHRGLDWLSYNLGRGRYLLEVDRLTAANGGNALYCGAAQTHRALSLLDFTELGLLHTGQLGDAVMGSYLKAPRQEPPALELSGYSTRLVERSRRVLDEEEQRHANDELARLSVRGFGGILSGYTTIGRFCDFASPFLDPDFLGYALRIPAKWRYEHSIYIEWMRRHAAELAAYPWEKTGLPVGAGALRVAATRRLRKWRRRLLRREVSSMNPFDQWLREDPTLRHGLDAYYRGRLDWLSGNPALLRDTDALYTAGRFIEKSQALTLLSVVSQLELKVR